MDQNLMTEGTVLPGARTNEWTNPMPGWELRPLFISWDAAAPRLFCCGLC